MFFVMSCTEIAQTFAFLLILLAMIFSGLCLINLYRNFSEIYGMLVCHGEILCTQCILRKR